MKDPSYLLVLSRVAAATKREPWRGGISLPISPRLLESAETTENLGLLFLPGNVKVWFSEYISDTRDARRTSGRAPTISSILGCCCGGCCCGCDGCGWEGAAADPAAAVAATAVVEATESGVVEVTLSCGCWWMLHVLYSDVEDFMASVAQIRLQFWCRHARQQARACCQRSPCCCQKKLGTLGELVRLEKYRDWREIRTRLCFFQSFPVVILMPNFSFRQGSRQDWTEFGSSLIK